MTHSKKPAGYRSIRGIRQGGGGPAIVSFPCFITGMMGAKPVPLLHSDHVIRLTYVHPVALMLIRIFQKYGIREPA